MFKFINKIKNKEYSKEKGFSLLELSVAVGIAAIVGAVGIVATTGFIGSAETKKDNYVANAERAIAEAESSSLALGETGSTGGTNSSGEEETEESEETPAAPSVPTTVLASDIASTEATLTWTAPETGEVGEYIVTLNGDVQGTEPIPNDVFSYVFTELTVNTYYEAKVFAKSNDGTLSEAATEKFYTAFRPMVATGGDKVYDILQDGTVYRVHEFTTVGESSFAVANTGETGEVEYLIVAGGGGGKNVQTGTVGSSPGGAGAYRSSVVGELSGGNNIAEPLIKVNIQSYPIFVGDGGNGGALGANNNGANGFASSAFGISAEGGEGGRRTPGEGGDAGGAPQHGFLGGAQSYSAIFGYGNPSGGGGGAGRVGQSVSSLNAAGGKGGDGLTSSITGTAVTRAGGGGGGRQYGSFGAGGSGGGGAGNGQSGASNTGGGGGGTSSSGGAPGSGGSGLVIVRYPIQFTSVQ